ncbi:DUF3558 domain-containing protein [Nocardia carnea]|uniref:DUF3558 domain-containing protein n=1 Tax=Nocardia carnea TaxID=37328 RepID=UPI002456B5A1|nr:DUF3558 domain-containing protein [Nocardia carnea]
MRSVAVPVLLVVALTSACGDQNDEPASSPATSAATTTPSIAVSVPPTSRQANMGRAPVNSDPCRELGDDVVTKAGFDPGTRQRIDRIFDTYSFVGCQFDHKERDQFGMNSPTRTLFVNSTNITLDEFRAREGERAEPAQVNGRNAISYQSPEAEACYIVVETGAGTLSIGKSVAGVLTQEKPCDRMQEIAETIASAMPG